MQAFHGDRPNVRKQIYFRDVIKFYRPYVLEEKPVYVSFILSSDSLRRPVMALYLFHVSFYKAQ